MHAIHVEVSEAVARLGVALLLGSIIGIERQWRQKMAGLRTNALVALGACGFVVFSAMVGEGDPTRVAAQVVTGIGFLGAGVILREGINVHGLNTAATIWCSAMVGTFAGSGYWAPSIVAAIFVTGANLLLRPVAKAINRHTLFSKNIETVYSVKLVCKAADEAHTRDLLMRSLAATHLGLQGMTSSDVPDGSQVRITAQVISMKRDDAALEEIVGRLSLDCHVTSAAWAVDHLLTDL